MTDWNTVIEILVLLFLLLVTAFTSISETSIMAVSRLRLRRLAFDGSKKAQIILKILETPEKFFSAILVTNNLVNTLIASLVTAIMIYIIGNETKGIFIATVIVTFLIIVFEVVSKTLAARHPEAASLAIARAVKALISALSPIIKVMSVITNSIVNLLTGKAKAKPYLLSEEEIRALIKIGEEEDILHKDKYKMLSKVFEFSEAIVRNVMTPKKKMVSIDVRANTDDMLFTVIESGYSRLPVYEGSPDNIIGIVNMKDLLALSVNKGLIVLQDVLYPPVFIPGTKKIKELLKEFQKGHTHLAIVRDPQNKVEGLITLEDLLEEIVGEIEDEYDIRSF